MEAGLIKVTQAGVQREQRWILRFIDWEIQEGERWALLGLNGSGKTTLVQLLTGYLWPMEGNIQYTWERDGDRDLRRIRRLIAYASNALVDMLHPQDTVEDIVAGGCFATIGLHDALTLAQAEHITRLLTIFQLTSLARAPYHTLSQGERQRVVLARALATQPRLLILDEPCSGLDFVQRELFLSMLQELLRQDTTLALVYITHRVEEIIPEINKAIFLKDGLILGKGTSQEMLSAAHLGLLYGREVAVLEQNGRRLVTPPR